MFTPLSVPSDKDGADVIEYHSLRNDFLVPIIKMEV